MAPIKLIPNVVPDVSSMAEICPLKSLCLQSCLMSADTVEWSILLTGAEQPDVEIFRNIRYSHEGKWTKETKYFFVVEVR